MSSIKLKPLSEQVIVITGASSGIGLATAFLAARKGATVVLAARSEQALAEVTARIVREGGDALFIPCDVSKRSDIDRVVRETISRYGRIDTWVNNAGVSNRQEQDQAPINPQGTLEKSGELVGNSGRVKGSG